MKQKNRFSNLFPLLTAAALAGVALFTPGCNDDGAENAGEAVDEAMDDAGDTLEDAADDVQDAVD